MAKLTVNLKGNAAKKTLFDCTDWAKILKNVREDESCHADKRNVTNEWLTGGFCFQVWAVHCDWSSATERCRKYSGSEWHCKCQMAALVHRIFILHPKTQEYLCEKSLFFYYYYYYFLSPMPNARLQRLTHFWRSALLLSSLICATCSCLDLRPQSLWVKKTNL